MYISSHIEIILSNTAPQFRMFFFQCWFYWRVLFCMLSSNNLCFCAYHLVSIFFPYLDCPFGYWPSVYNAFLYVDPIEDCYFIYCPCLLLFRSLLTLPFRIYCPISPLLCDCNSHGKRCIIKIGYQINNIAMSSICNVILYNVPKLTLLFCVLFHI